LRLITLGLGESAQSDDLVFSNTLGA